MSAPQVLRHDPDAEAVVLSACMLSADALDEIVPLLSPEDFGVASNRRVFAAIQDLVTAGDSVDSVAVLGRLRETNQLERVGGAPYVVTLMDSTPTLAHPEQHARKVRDHARARRARALLQKLAGESAAPDVGIDAFLERCEREIFALAGEGGGDQETAADYEEIARRTLEWVEAARRGPGYSGVPTGFRSLDNHVGGMETGDLWYVAGRPSAGKSTFTMQAVEHAAALGWGAVVFSLEEKLIKMMLRSVSRRAQIPHRHLKSGRLSPNEWSAFTDELGEVGRLPIIVDDNGKLTPGTLRSRLRRHIAALRKRFPKTEVKLVVVDHTQLVSVDQKGENRNADVTEISRSFKRTAKEFDVCMVCLSQLNRPPKAQRVARPTLTDLRESGALEQDADVVLFVHRPDQYRSPDEWDHLAELIVGKGRNCGEGLHESVWDNKCLTFRELEPELGFGEEEAF